MKFKNVVLRKQFKAFYNSLPRITNITNIFLRQYNFKKFLYMIKTFLSTTVNVSRFLYDFSISNHILLQILNVQCPLLAIVRRFQITPLDYKHYKKDNFKSKSNRDTMISNYEVLQHTTWIFPLSSPVIHILVPLTITIILTKVPESV